MLTLSVQMDMRSTEKQSGGRPALISCSTSNGLMTLTLQILEKSGCFKTFDICCPRSALTSRPEPHCCKILRSVSDANKKQGASNGFIKATIWSFSSGSNRTPKESLSLINKYEEI